MESYDGMTIETEADDPMLGRRLNPLIVERFKLGPAQPIHFPHEVGILRGRRRLMMPAEARPTEIEYFGVLSKGRAFILHALPV